MAHVRILRMFTLPSLGWPSSCFPQGARLLYQPRCYLCLAPLLHKNFASTSSLPVNPLLASLSASLPVSSSSESRRSVQTRAAPAKLSRGSPRPLQRTKQTAQQPSKRPGRQKGTASKEQQPAKRDSLDWGSSGSLKPSAALQARLDVIRTPAPAVVDTLGSPEDEPQSTADDAASLAQAEAAESGPEPSRDSFEEELELPAPSDVRIKSASYVTSSVKVEQCPNTGLPEFAVIGRSNVGKSSLINLLTGRKDLALVSKTPGKTRCINHFLINDSWYLVDLPGYGYAKQSQTSRVEWSKFTQEYFKNRETLVNVLLLVDGSVPTQNVDLGCAEWLAQNEVPFTLVFTKTDKRKKKCPSPSENIRQFEEELSKLIGALPVSLSTSATAKQGKGDLLTFVAQLRELHQRNLSFA